MSREFIKKLRIKPQTWRYLTKAAPFMGVVFGGALILKNFQEYKMVLYKLKVQGTISDIEAERIAEDQGLNRKEMWKEQILSRDNDKKQLESTLLTKEWHNIRIPRSEEGDPRSVQALRRLQILEEAQSQEVDAERAMKARKRLEPLMADTKEYLEIAHKYLDAFNEKHKKNARLLSLEEQAVQAMHFSDFFRRHLQKGRKMMPKLEACLELGGLSAKEMQELKVVIEDLAQTNAEVMRCMKYAWDERDIWLSSVKN